MTLALALGGFGNAPVTKGLLIATAGASVLHQSAKSGIVARHALGAASRVLVFRHPGELLMGAMLIYYFRSLERRAGSSKFACFVTFTTGLSLALQVLVSKYAHLPILPAGPYGYIFASFVQYFFDFPSTSHFGWKLSNKTFFYMAGLQLLHSGGLPAVVLGVSGLFAGLLYRLDVLGIKRLKMPGPVSRLFSKALGPFLTSPTPQVIQPGSVGRSGRRPSAARAARVSAATRPAAAVVAPPRPVVAEASPEAVETLLGMGFERERVERALVATGNDVPAALELLVS